MTGAKKIFSKIIAILIMLALGFAIGLGIGIALNHMVGRFAFIELLIMLLVAYFLNVVLHEAGHLVMGLATGYRFLSFRVLSWTLIRGENGRYRVNSFNIPGTLGQCLLVPPELDDNGHMPVVLYNLGGIIVNFIIAAVSAYIVFFTPIAGHGRIFLTLFGIIGLMQGIENAIPLESVGINNDGTNLKRLASSPRVVQSLWKQLMINAYQTYGYLFQQMPDELFAMPSMDEMKDNLVSVEALFVENREMEIMNHENTLDTLDFILDSRKINLMNIYRITAESDRILVKLLLGKPVTVERSFRKSLSQLSVFPNVIVAQYAIARLVDKNEKEAEKLRKKFDKVIGKYPFRSDKLTLPRYMNEVDKKA